MNWLEKLGDLMFVGGLGGVIASALPQHVQRRVRERLSDLNPYNFIAGNDDLMRAARLAWVRAALEVLDAAKETIDAGYSKYDRTDTLRFEQHARSILLKIRSDTLDRRTNPGNSPIDHHLEMIIQGTSEFVAPGESDPLDQSLADDFDGTLAALTAWPVRKLPPIFAHIAQTGLPTIDQSTQRKFSELVFAAFAELLKSPDQYPEAKSAFTIATGNAARALSQEILVRIKTIDDKFDNYVANSDALEIFKTGAATLPRLLAGQERIEALALTINMKVDAIKDDINDVSQTLQRIEAMGRSSADVPEAEAFAEYQALVRHIKQREFEQVLTAHKPRSLGAYRAWCIACWAQPRYAIDKQFTPLTLMLDQGEDVQGERYQKDRAFDDLRDVLQAVDPIKEPVIVVTGAPGSGKSTLLRRLELDLASSALRAPASEASGAPETPEAPLTIFLPLNTFGQKDSIPEPIDWLAKHWTEMTTGLLDFNELLRNPLILLLDGLNEMPHASRADYDQRLAVWKRFLDQLVLNHPNVRVVFSCRTFDYGSKLTTKELLRVPQVEVTPLTSVQVERFVELYSSENAQTLWAQLKNSPQLDLYRSPYYLKLLIDQVSDGKIPEGRAELFTGHVRAMLKREIDGDNGHLHDSYFLHPRDRERFGQWQTAYQLPARGQLFKVLAAFAYQLQMQRDAEDKSQVRVDYEEALANLIDVPEVQQEGLLKVAADLQILDLPNDDVLFVHQLLQEYFAARHLAERFNATSKPEEWAVLIKLAQTQWLEVNITPSVEELLQTLAKSATLPDLPTTGWEETFLLAAAMVNTPDDFLRALAKVNLPLAGRCTAQPDVMVSDSLCQDLQQELVERSRDQATDLRARINAANALGVLGDPRFEERQGPLGRFLLPPMVAIEGGVYAIGSDEGFYENEAPRHDVHVAPFSLGQFPVTNAEFQCFIDAGGYSDLRWWDTPAAQSWQRGEGTGEGSRRNWRHWRDRFKSEVGLFERLTEEQAWAEEQIQQWQENIAMTNEAFEAMLVKQWPDQRFMQPEFLNDSKFSTPNQPVVGICWFEVRAYCAWLSAQTGECYRLPTEAEWEAAAGGKDSRRYAWGDAFDALRCNALDIKLRRTAPVGVFSSGDTPYLNGQQDIADLSGNIWEWTGSSYRPYPYKNDDGREYADIEENRVLRGGSWFNSPDFVRSSVRDNDHPDDRNDVVGFRVLCSSPIE